ncbi:MAG TPA: S41 family peptidase [Anaerolineales bacterium]|nr:S41 family peptidase [Anaerolineales bacterium]
MKSSPFRSVLVMLALSMILNACTPKTETAVSSTPEPEPVAQSTGPTLVTGSVTYTNTFFTLGVAEPIIILEDQGGFVTRDRKFLIPVESQVIGQITSDFYSSPFTYSLSLPEKPNGTRHDVDQDGDQDAGVMVFAVAYWTNTWGDPYLERRDQGGGGWSSAYASTKVSDDSDSLYEIYGGKYLVYAPDARQQFPSGFGDDRKLFTDDDPIMDIPAGWSVIDLDQSPFAIDRSENPTLDLYEPEDTVVDDFSGLSYTEAFDKMLEKFKNEYAFTEIKEIDWDAKGAEFGPAFEEAEKKKDSHAYALALRDFLWSIPDTHVGFDQTALNDDFSKETTGGLGFAMRETDDGRVIANFILEGGPAAEAGMAWGAEILALDGKSVGDVVAATVPWSSPFSNPEIKGLQQLRYATRFKMDKETVGVTFKNPDGNEQTADLKVVNEIDSFSFASFRAGVDAEALPVEFDILPSGYGYIKISSFSDNDRLSILVWERAIQYFKDNQVPGIILDLRNNGGGSGWLADQMAAYFFNEEIVVGQTASYDDSTGEFFIDPDYEKKMYPPRAELQFDGPVVVMVGPNCASACEFFSYNMTINDRASVVGQYPSEGAGGSVEGFYMPEGTYVQLTIGRAMDADGNIHLEGRGVVPDVRVPVTLETLQRQAGGEDVILEAAEKVISQPQGAGVVPSGPPEVASASAASSAFQSGKSFLEDLAREKYETADFGAPGTLHYTIALNKSDTLIWMYAWCAASSEVLDQNFKNINLKFVLDGEEVPLEDLRREDLENSGQQCRLYYTALSNWPIGEHHLSITASFTAPINDGTTDYAAGDYVLDYAVYLKP